MWNCTVFLGYVMLSAMLNQWVFLGLLRAPFDRKYRLRVTPSHSPAAQESLRSD